MSSVRRRRVEFYLNFHLVSSSFFILIEFHAACSSVGMCEVFCGWFYNCTKPEMAIFADAIELNKHWNFQHAASKHSTLSLIVAPRQDKGSNMESSLT